MYRIGFDIVQQALVVGDDHGTGFRSLEFVETVGHNTQGIHIQSGIRLVQNGESRFQHRHLEYLVTLLLTATETFVHAAVGKLVIQFHNGALLAHQLQELAGGQGRQMAVLALLIHGSTHEVHHRHARNLYRSLERKKDSFMCTVLRTHGKQVLAIKGDGAARHFISRMSHQHVTQRTFTGTVLSHQRMYFTVTDSQVNAFQYLFAIDAGMQVFYL